MKIKNIIFKMFLLTTLLYFGSCETVDLDQLENPSSLDESLLNPVYTFNYVQLELAGFVESTNGFSQRVTRQIAMTGGNNYDNAFTEASFSGNWSTAYKMLNAVKIMEPKAIQNKEFYALGAAKVIRCYVLLTLTDMYGDIPVSEALQGNGNLTPKFDSSASVYSRILLELDDAVEILQRNDSNPTSAIQDLYYSSQNDWIRLANTIKLKMYCTARLAGPDFGVSDIGAAITAIINQDNYINAPSHDFAFRYGTNRNLPNNRHPVYNDQYELGGGAYIGNYMFWTMTTEKGFQVSSTGNSTATSNVDPRTGFYFYKQANVVPANYDQFILPNRIRPEHYNNVQFNSFYDSSVRTCFTVSNWVGGALIDNGFWGRDHGNNGGIPQDDTKRTVCGIYPIGGAYSNTTGSVQTSGNKGGLGAGITPMILSSYVHFMKAEAILTLGIPGDARAELEQGIRESIDKTINFLPDYKYTGTAPLSATLEAQKNWYVGTFILPRYDALNTDKKLELIIKEYYIAAWGNGIEPYNNYRRTGYPSNLQPTLEPVSGDFFYTALYPGNSVNNNPNTPTNVRSKKVFWDKANLILN
jgi:hypothetical protein